MNERMQQASGAVAAIAWLVSGSYLSLTTPAVPFLSWAVFWYLLTGIFLAPFVFGLPVFVLQRRLVTRAVMTPQTQTAASLALLAVEAFLVFLAARLVFLRQVVAPFLAAGGTT